MPKMPKIKPGPNPVTQASATKSSMISDWRSYELPGVHTTPGGLFGQKTGFSLIGGSN